MSKDKKPKVVPMRKQCIKLIEQLLVDVPVDLVLQRRPFTMVQVVFPVMFNLPMTVGVGFACVQWHDVWDEEVGSDIALRKAMSDVYVQLLALIQKRRSARQGFEVPHMPGTAKGDLLSLLQVCAAEVK